MLTDGQRYGGFCCFGRVGCSIQVKEEKAICYNIHCSSSQAVQYVDIPSSCSSRS